MAAVTGARKYCFGGRKGSWEASWGCLACIHVLWFACIHVLCSRRWPSASEDHVDLKRTNEHGWCASCRGSCCCSCNRSHDIHGVSSWDGWSCGCAKSCCIGHASTWSFAGGQQCSFELRMQQHLLSPVRGGSGQSAGSGRGCGSNFASPAAVLRFSKPCTNRRCRSASDDAPLSAAYVGSAQPWPSNVASWLGVPCTCLCAHRARRLHGLGSTHQWLWSSTLCDPGNTCRLYPDVVSVLRNDQFVEQSQTL